MRPGRHAGTFVLIALAALVGIYAAVFDRSGVLDDERAARARNVLPAFRRDEVARVVLDGGERLVLERETGPDADALPWRMVSPRQEPAEVGAVQALLAALEFASVVRRVPDGTGNLGLETPRVRGEVAMGRLVLRFALGAGAPSPEGAGYLRVDGEGTFVVSRDLVAELTKSVDGYRERTLLPVAGADVARVEIDGVALERIDAVSFRASGGTRVSREVASRVLAGLAELRAESFLGEDAAARTQAGAVTRLVRVTAKSGASYELRIGAACPQGGVVATRAVPERAAACVPAAVLEALTPPGPATADTRLVAAAADEIESVRIVAADARLDVARAGSGYRLREPEARALDSEESEAAGALIAAIAAARGELGATLPAGPTTRVTVTRSVDGVQEELQIAGGRARRSDGAVLALDPETAVLFRPDVTSLRPRRVYPEDLRNAPVTGVATTCGSTPQEVVRKNGVFAMRAPAGFPADGAAALALANDVLGARADRWLDAASFPSAAPACTVTLALETPEGGTRSLTLTLVREPAAGATGVLARAEAGTFVAPRELRESATRLLVSRHVFAIDPTFVARATLARGPGTISLDGEAGAALEALEGLRADDVLHLGPPRPEEQLSPPRATLTLTLRTDAGPSLRVFTFGAPATSHGRDAVHARASGVDATYLLPRGRLAPLLDAP